MSDPHGLTGFSPVRRRCTAMHPTAPRRRGLISKSDGTHTSKCPYMGVCNQRRRRAIRGDIGAYGVDLRCTFTRCTLMHDSAPKPSEVARR